MRMTIAITFTDKVTKEQLEKRAKELKEAFQLGVEVGDVEKFSINILE